MFRNTLAKFGLRNLYRTTWHTPAANRIPPIMKLHDLHTKGDQELVTFLKDEIAAESKSLKPTVQKSVGDYQITADRAEVTLERKFNDEIIKISFNVNHTVDSEVADETPPRGDKPQESEESEMRSKPNFDIDIKKGSQTLTFSCSFLREHPADPQEQEEYNDLFLIEEIALYEGELNEQTYAVAGDILDGYLYDLFMNMLEDRGITNAFVEQLSDFSTEYEHQLYVGMLKNLQNFVQKK